MSNVNLPLVVGLCGRSGAGKSFVSEIFASFGIPSIDTDGVYREMTGIPCDGKLSDCMTELVGAFGETILSHDLSLNRRALADIVFADNGSDSLSKLNEITHKHILNETERRIAVYGKNGIFAVIVDAPVLFESGFHKKCDYIIAASASEETLVRRIMARDGISKDDAERRLKVQISDRDLRERVDFVIETDAELPDLKLKVKAIVEKLKHP